MDGFSDALSQHFGSPREMINANSQAEATQAEKLQTEVRGLISEIDQRLDAIQNMETGNANMDGITEQLNAMSERLETHVHKENVRVYRNVQASLVDELGKQAETIDAKLADNNTAVIEGLNQKIEMLAAMLNTLNEQQKSQGQAVSGMAAQLNQTEENVQKAVKNRALLPIQIIMFVIVLGELAINILLTMGYL